MLNLRASLDLPREFELDLDWRAVSAVPYLEGYDALDVRLAWWPKRSLELSLSIENALDNEHIEFIDQIAMQAGASLGRTFFARLAWRPRG
jgi:outer membrane receptor for monomeric catechols